MIAGDQKSLIINNKRAKKEKAEQEKKWSRQKYHDDGTGSCRKRKGEVSGEY